jgi:sugar/nucleoside kinase (ribokinase family)
MKAPRSTQGRPTGLFVGLAAVDVSYMVDEIPRRNQKISVAAQQINAGGPATNPAITFAFLGGKASLVTGIGSHPLSAVIRNDLRLRSVSIHDLARTRRDAPPISSILVDRPSGERTVVSANAAVFSPLDGEFSQGWLDGVSIVEVDGQYMPACIAAAKAARARGIPVVLDSGSWKTGMEKLLPHLNTVICSQDFCPPNCRSQNDVLQFLASRKIHRIAITRGASSIRFLENGTQGEIPVRKIRAVDTLGAGDIFHGAYCYYACDSSRSFRDALAAAARVASFSCRYSGTRSWMTAYPE